MILAIDQGTTSTRTILMNRRGRLISSSQIAIPQHFPRPGWVEHDPRDIWNSVRGTIQRALRSGNVRPQQIDGIALTNQRETVSLFENHRPLHRFIVWQDRRTTRECSRLKTYASTVLKRSGLPLDPYFSATKIAWIKKQLKISSRRAVHFRTIDSFLIHQLTGVNAIEATNASRTSLLDLRRREWCDDLLEIFNVPRKFAPEVVTSEGLELKTRGLDFLPDGIPVTAVLGDQQAALFGQIGWKPGDGKITFGTGSFVLMNTGSRAVTSKNGLCSTLAIEWRDRRPEYAIEGSCFISGAWIQWLRDQIKIIESAFLSEKLARETDSAHDVLVIPALSGLGAPFWRPQLRGAILGLTRGTSRAHIMRASLEALAFQNRALIDAMIADTQNKRGVWMVDGGAVRNDLLLQIQADLLQTTIIRPKNLEATALGVGWLGLKSLGFLSLSDIKKIWREDKRFVPSRQKKNQKKNQEKDISHYYQRWLCAVRQMPDHTQSA